MTRLKIQQLTSINYKITFDEQKQILGGGAGPHNITKSANTLWRGYADERYSIETDGQEVNFVDGGNFLVGTIDAETGESVRVSNPNSKQ